MTRALPAVLGVLTDLITGIFTAALPGCAPTASSTSQTQTQAQGQPRAQEQARDSETDTGWPRVFKSENQTITVFQPQVESWKGNQLKGRAAVAIENPASPQPTYGVIWISARTDVDRANHVVTLEDLNVSKVSFPSKPENEPSYLALFRKDAPKTLRTIALDRLEASLAVARLQGQRVAKVRNEPPRIIYSMAPAILILIDGKPVLRDSGVKNIVRVINTRALMLLDQSNGKYYFYLGDRWMEAAAATGPWKEAKDLSGEVKDSLNQAKDLAVAQKRVDLLNDPNSAVMQELKKDVVPALYVSEVPAALIQTQGKAELQPIPSTRLLYVSNTNDSIFLDPNTQDFFVLYEGRWYRSKNLNGPWDFVSAKKLPTDFAKIPANHPKGAVRAWVTGTPEAQEAGIADQIPQTATVDRKNAKLDVRYDGSPEFRDIEGTSLKYAVNTPTPVIEVDPHNYYAVYNGVWFVAGAPAGPWVVATRVPAAIYKIPPSSPLYYVTYVHVYGYTPDVVYVGYLPGYLGSYYCADGTVVLGTGYIYPPWAGTVWIGAPYFGWWGYWGWWGYGYAPPVSTTVTVNQTNIYGTNVYRAWSGPVVRNAWEPHELANRNRFAGPGGAQALRPDNVYAGGLGNVYRYNGHGWEQKTPQGWETLGRSSGLEQERAARQMGESRWDSFRGGAGGPAPAPPAIPHAAPPAAPAMPRAAAPPPPPPASRAGQVGGLRHR